MSTTATRKQLDFIKPTVEFYPHQVEGVRELARMNSFLLADEMGLGKSLQALTVTAIDFQMGFANRFIVVCPASLKGNWWEEMGEHTKFKMVVLDGTPKKRRAIIEDFANSDNHALIVNYEQVKAHLEELNAIGFDIAIYDEAHYIKNPTAQRTKAAQGLKAKRHFLLTGSPMLGHVNDLWSLLYRIDNNMEKYYHFLNRYAVFGGYKDKQIVGVKNRDELYGRLQKVMVRRLKSEVLDLPEKQHITIRLDLSPLQRKLYDEIKEEMKLIAPDPMSASPMEIENALTKFLRLKQVCGTPAALHFEDGTQYPDESAKLDRAVEMVQEIVQELGEHVVVFTQFRDVQECMVRRLNDKKVGIPNYQLHGGIPAEERVPIVTTWKKGEPSAMVAMLQVAGVGLNMTAARKAIFLDKLFVPKLNEQAEDRIHRIGASTSQPVQIYQLAMRKTIEQRVETILKTKRQLFDDVVETDSFKKKLYAALMAEDDDE